MNVGAADHRRWLWGVVISWLTAVCLTFQPASYVQAQSTGEETSQAPSSAQRIADAINQARAAAGLAPLAVNPLLNQAAQTHTDDILTNRNYSHWGTDGTLVRDRVARTGYAANPWVSENWVSSTSADGAMNWWMNDWIHRVNILNPNWTEMGVGASGRGTGEMIFVTVFSAGTSGRTEARVAAAAAAPATAPAAAPVAAVAPASVPPNGMNYTIRPGDTLLRVAGRYGLDWAKMASVNGLSDSSVLQIGQVIRIPGSQTPEAVGATAQVLAEAKLSMQLVGAADASEQFITLANSWMIGGSPMNAAVLHTSSSERITYTVESGDTLFSIAGRFGMTWQDLAALNGFGEQDYLQIGQVMWVPKPGAAPVIKPNESVTQVAAANAGADLEAGGDYYKVVEGDTIFAIAVRYQLDWLELLRLNGLDESSLLQPGQSIRLR
jgi:uncharacterized protein YkwD/LysM repeat protein